MNRLKKIGAALALIALLSAVVCITAGLHFAERDSLIYVATITDPKPYPSLKVVGVNSAELARLSARRYLHRGNQYPALLKTVVLAAEDENFYSHTGLSFFGVLRATLVNLARGRWSQGASTISQQVVKLVAERRDKNLFRKIFEVFVTLEIETKVSKDTILAFYLDNIYLGEGAYGYAAAAETYFSRPIEQLNIAELALLAGLAPAPSRYNPFHQIQYAYDRQHYVLRRLLDTHAIDRVAYDRALAQKLYLHRKDKVVPDLVGGVAWLTLESIPDDLKDNFLDGESTLKTHLSAEASAELKMQHSTPASFNLARIDHFADGWHRARLGQAVHDLIVAQQAPGVYEFSRVDTTRDSASEGTWLLNPNTPIETGEKYVAVVEANGSHHSLRIGNRSWLPLVPAAEAAAVGDVLCLRFRGSASTPPSWEPCIAAEKIWMRFEQKQLVAFYREPPAWGLEAVTALRGTVQGSAIATDTASSTPAAGKPIEQTFVFTELGMLFAPESSKLNQRQVWVPPAIRDRAVKEPLH